VGGVWVFGLRLPRRTQCALQGKRKPNAPAPRGIVYRILVNIRPIARCLVISSRTVYILEYILNLVLEYGCYNSKLRSGILNNFTKKYCSTPLSNRVEMDQEPLIYITQQENFKKMLGKYKKSRILIARQHFSMALLWEQLHRDFLRFVHWSRPCGR
jgi:hypothetical protein